jgi:hypothetical protein
LSADDPTRILTEEEVAEATRALCAQLTRSFPGVPKDLFEFLESTVRMMPLSFRFCQAREATGRTLKEFAAELKVPQYRLKGIEAGQPLRVDGRILARYAAALGLESWLDEWAAANAALAAELGLGAGAAATGATVTPAIFRLRLTLQGVTPPVWRLIELPATATFQDLHAAIQRAMSWRDRHLHLFTVPDGRGGRFEIGAAGPDRAHDVIPGARRRLHQHLVNVGQEIVYTYDFGDDWRHTVRLEAIAPAAEGVSYPRCLDGARRCPPEDCGGLPGYEEFLRAVTNPAHREHKAMLRWCGGAFDPEAFDARAVVFAAVKPVRRKAPRSPRREDLSRDKSRPARKTAPRRRTAENLWLELAADADAASRKASSNWARYGLPADAVALRTAEQARQPAPPLTDTELPDEVRETLSGLDEAIRRFGPLPEAMEAWVGLEFPPEAQERPFPFAEGYHLCLIGVVSASVLARPALFAAGPAGALLRVTVSAALPIVGEIEKPGEMEMVLPRDSCFRVEAITWSGIIVDERGRRWERTVLEATQIPMREPRRARRRGGFTGPAARRWAALGVESQMRILNNVWCGACLETTTIVEPAGRVERGDLILEGACIKCGGSVARLVEGE